MKRLLVITAFVLFAGIAFGQTLNKGSIIAFYESEVTLKPDVTMDQFLDFLTNKWFPEANKLFGVEGLQFVLLQSDRGEKKGNFAFIYYFESAEARNKFWPDEGGDTGFFNEIIQKMQPLQEEYQNMVASSNSVGSDWKVL